MTIWIVHKYSVLAGQGSFIYEDETSVMWMELPSSSLSIDY